MKQPKMYRQGDVLLLAIDAIPADASQVKTGGRIVLAYGEVTGHAHAIDDKQATEYRSKTAVPIFDYECERFLQVAVKAELRHDEHATIEVPAGSYAIIQQREYTPTEIRNVAD